MANIVCPISGLQFKVNHVPMILRNGELAHPIFYLDQKRLLNLYARYSSEQGLNDIDSYLLFLALLNITDHVKFHDPARYRGKITMKIIANNIDKLVKIIWETDSIWHPTFNQPDFVIREANSTNNLSNINEWIKLWENNIAVFKLAPMMRRQKESLRKIADKLEAVAISGVTGTKLASIVAKWADAAGEFPTDKRDLWMKTIRTCFNEDKMFITDKRLLLEIKAHCELNIEAGSLHFHTLYRVLTTGIKYHNNYLGLGDIPDLTTGFKILPDKLDNNTIALMAIVESAPSEEPIKENYPSNLAFIRAKLKYRVAQQYKAKEEAVDATMAGEHVDV